MRAKPIARISAGPQTLDSCTRHAPANKEEGRGAAHAEIRATHFASPRG